MDKLGTLNQANCGRVADLLVATGRVPDWWPGGCRLFRRGATAPDIHGQGKVAARRGGVAAAEGQAGGKEWKGPLAWLSSGQGPAKAVS